MLHSEQASRQHARIFWNNDSGWLIVDLDSRNGTAVNGQKIRSETKLHDGDQIHVAGFSIQFAHQIDTVSDSNDPQDENSQATEDQATAAIDLGIGTFDASAITDRRRHSDYLRKDERGSVPVELLQFAFTLARTDSLSEAASTTIDCLVQSLSFDSAGIYAVETFNDSQSLLDLPLVATHQSGGRSYRRPPDSLIQNVVSENGTALLARNILGDDTLATENSRGEIEVESVILAPLRDHQSRCLGMIHLTTSGEGRPLESRDLQFVVAIAEILAEAVSRLETQQKLSVSLRRSRRRIHQLQQQLGDKVKMIGESEAISGVIEKVTLAAPTSATVLIRGESGVGKELVAAAIHHASERKESPLICLNCAALSATLLESELFGHEKGAFTGATERKRGKFEMADGGTLMLDEIGEMNAELQAKLLRVLEGQPFERVGGHQPIRTDVRVVAATNRDLQMMVSDEEFRQDLYYRLHVVEIVVPPLRDRGKDVLLLAKYFLKRFNLEMGRRIDGFTPAATKRLMAYHWPGNIRELRNTIERAVVLNQKSMIEETDLLLSPAQVAGAEVGNPIQSSIDVETSLASLERMHIQRVLRHTEGNKSRAASILGIERSTLDRKLKKFAKE